MSDYKEALRLFHSLYPSSSLPRMWRAPGRVNLIGEHTDYNLGLVLPMAIELDCVVTCAASGDDWLRVHSKQLGQTAQWRVEDLPNAAPRGDWSDRVAGIAWELTRRGISLAGQNVSIDSQIPLGGGLSSSAGLGVAFTLALGGPRDPREIATLARAAETDFVGVPCGIMDQFISACGQAGAAMLLDCRTLDSRPVELPKRLAVVTVNSMVKRELGHSAYHTRVDECIRAAQALQVSSLRDVENGRLGTLNGVLRKRARHVVTENARVCAFANAAGRKDLEEMGRLVVESHRSLRDDYEVSCPELDFLVDTAIALPGVLGARMMGGGFGGSTVNLVLDEAVESFKTALDSSYRRFCGRVPEIHVCLASEGASEMSL